MILDCLMRVEGFIDFGEDVDELGQEDMFQNGEYSFSHATGVDIRREQHVPVLRRSSTPSNHTSQIIEEARY